MRAAGTGACSVTAWYTAAAAPTTTTPINITTNGNFLAGVG